MTALKITVLVLRILIWILLFIPALIVFSARWLIFRWRFIRGLTKAGIPLRSAAEFAREVSPFTLMSVFGNRIRKRRGRAF